MFGPNASFGVQTTSMKKLSVFGAFRFSEFRIRDCVPSIGTNLVLNRAFAVFSDRYDISFMSYSLLLLLQLLSFSYMCRIVTAYGLLLWLLYSGKVVQFQ